MADQSMQMDAPPTFEIPKARQIDVQPATAPQPYSQGAGFMGKAGAGAAISASLLEGWMQGTRIKEDRLRQQAQTKLDGARWGYAQSIGTLRDWRVQNSDPEKYTDQQTGKTGRDAWNAKYKVLVADANNSRDFYADTMQGMAIKEEPKAKGVGGKLKAAGKKMGKGLTAQPPEMFAQAAIDHFKGQNVEQASTPDPYSAQKLEHEKVATDVDRQRLSAETTRNQHEKQLMDANQSVAKAAQNNDYTAMAKAMNTVNALSGHADKIITPDTLKVQAAETRVNAQRSMVLGGIFDKAQTGKPLNENEQAIYNAAWGIQSEKTPYQGYVHDVGPGKLFATEHDASKAFLEDQSAFKNAYRPESMLEMTKQAIMVNLQHELGRDPTPDEFSKAFLNYRFGADPEGNAIKKKPTTDQDRTDALSQAIEAATDSNPDWKWFSFHKAGSKGERAFLFDPVTAKSGKRTVRGDKAGETKEIQSPFYKGHWFTKNEDSTKDEYQKFVDAVQQSLRENNPNLSDEDMKAFRLPLVTPQKDEKQQTNVTPKAQPPAILQGGGDKPKRYTLSKNGASKGPIELSPDQVEYWKKNGWNPQAQ